MLNLFGVNQELKLKYQFVKYPSDYFLIKKRRKK